MQGDALLGMHKLSQDTAHFTSPVSVKSELHSLAGQCGWLSIIHLSKQKRRLAIRSDAFQKMLRTTGTAGGNYRDGHRSTNRIDQFDVKAGVGAVLVCDE